jgi:hypothetical protein
MRTVLFFPFAEPAGVPPTDRMGTVADLGIATGLTRPDRTAAWTGGGHTYDQATLHGWTAGDTADGDSILQRDVTIQALVVFDATAAADPACVVCRGLDGSASEYYAWGLELANQGGGYVEIRWLWMTSAGVLATVAPGVYQHAGDTAELLITATRRWVSTTEVVCRYYANGELLAEVTSADGDIGGGTTGHLSVGARKEGGTWGNGFSGVIDQLKVTDYEMSAEEVAAVYERLAVHQPNGVVALRQLEPPGVPWSKDASTDIGKLLTNAGQALGLAAATAEELRQNALPSRAYADTLGRWEWLVGLPQNHRTALDTRRARVVAQLSRENGYAPPQVRQALSGPLDLHPDDIELLEYSPTITDDFSTLESELWHAEPAAAWSIVAGQLQLFAAAGTDIRHTAAGGWQWHHCRMPIEDAVGLVVQTKLTFHGSLPSFATAGLFLYERVSQDALFFGAHYEGGVYRIGWRKVSAGVDGGWTDLENPAANATYYLRATRVPSASHFAHWKLEWSTTGFDAMSSTTIIPNLPDPNNAGLAATSSAPMVAPDLTVTFDDFLARVPRSTRGWHWYAFRNPDLAGSPDMLGANATLKTLKPAHTHAYAVTSRSLLCDTDGSVCDGGPLGDL